MVSKREFLKSISLFTTLSETDFNKLTDIADEFTYKNGEYIFYEGDSPDWLCIVKEGNVKVLKQHEEGKETILRIFKPGEIFGAMPVFDRRPYPASAISMGETVIQKFYYTDCLDFFSKKPDVAMKLIGDIGKMQREFVDKFNVSLTTRVEKRIATTLMNLASKSNLEGKKDIELHLTRKDIASMVGTTIETTIRIMSRLQKEGLIESKKGYITILRPDLLDRIGSEGEE
ncbi:MAG: Crp/Fnr family transcriptional regulator [Nitrospira sp.]|nr:Crp/Fnr family transcriptional regulator [Nitrospira sp.]